MINFKKKILFGSPYVLGKVPIRFPSHSKMGPHWVPILNKIWSPWHLGAVQGENIVFRASMQWILSTTWWLLNHLRKGGQFSPTLIYKPIDLLLWALTSVTLPEGKRIGLKAHPQSLSHILYSCHCYVCVCRAALRIHSSLLYVSLQTFVNLIYHEFQIVLKWLGLPIFSLNSV